MQPGPQGHPDARAHRWPWERGWFSWACAKVSLTIWTKWRMELGVFSVGDIWVLSAVCFEARPALGFSHGVKSALWQAVVSVENIVLMYSSWKRSYKSFLSVVSSASYLANVQFTNVLGHFANGWKASSPTSWIRCSIENVPTYAMTRPWLFDVYRIVFLQVLLPRTLRLEKYLFLCCVCARWCSNAVRNVTHYGRVWQGCISSFRRKMARHSTR